MSYRRRIALYVLYAPLALLWLILRTVAAAPFMVIWLIAESRDDTEVMERTSRIIERIIGEDDQ